MSSKLCIEGKKKNKLGLSWAKLKLSLVRVVNLVKVDVLVGVQY